MFQNLFSHSIVANMNESTELWLKSSHASQRLGVSDETLRRWSDKNLIHYIRTPTGQRLYNVNSVIQPNLKHQRQKTDVIYSRVSSSHQKKAGDLDRQRKQLESKYPNHTSISDVGSGLNFHRPGLKRILDLAFQGNLGEVVVAHRDRLCRFAFDLLQHILEHFGAKITVESELDRTPESELAEDLLAVVSVFSARFNGMRRYHKRRDEQEDNQDDESQIDANEQAEDHSEAVDGNDQVSVQPSKPSRKRKASQVGVSETETSDTDRPKSAKRKRLAKADTERSETIGDKATVGSIQHELCQNQQESISSQIQEQKDEQN
uniref:Site-specific serine recombinase n=1 Tax=Clandestinovirus TaxID=2831644 RepID=A0A8F8KLX3_9VIRU|nr:site-specific serine recombinase [Clandestinovirus]